MSVTYDESALQADTDAGRLARVRLAIGDVTNTPGAPAIFTDAEIAAFLNTAADNETDAAVAALDAWIVRLLRYPSSESGSNYSLTRQTVSSLQQLRATLAAAGSGGGLETATIDVSTPNELLDSYRPAYWDLDTLPPVE